MRGGDVPERLGAWADLARSDLVCPRYLLENIAARGYRAPTDVQAHVVPALVHGRDVLVAAPTGSGKTAAYCIPLLRLLRKPKNQYAGSLYSPH